MIRAALALSFCLSVPAVTFAQADAARFRISVNGGGQIGNTTVAQSFSVDKNLEPAPITADASVKRGVLADAGVVARLAGPLGVGFALSYMSRSTAADVTAKIPHPFFFTQLRTISGTAPIDRTEIAGHIDVVYRVPIDGRFDVLLQGGPSIFNVRHTLVTDVTYVDVFPFDSPTFGAAVTANATQTVVGLNAGADLTWRLRRTVGAGALIRYAHARATVGVANNPSVNVDAGGFQLGAGLRLLF